MSVAGSPCFFCAYGFVGLKITESEPSPQKSEPTLPKNLNLFKANSKSIHCDKFVKFLCSEKKNLKNILTRRQKECMIQTLTRCQNEKAGGHEYEKNIESQLALYPTPVIVIGAMDGEKPAWTLVAYVGNIDHDRVLSVERKQIKAICSDMRLGRRGRRSFKYRRLSWNVPRLMNMILRVLKALSARSTIHM